MFSRLVRRYNRALLAVSGVAIALYALLPSPDIARGVLIGGLLAILYLGLMREQLEAVSEGRPARVRGRLFATFLVRLALLAAGLSIALWLSRKAFWSAVAALGVMYGFLLLGMSRELRREKRLPNGEPAGSVCDGLTGQSIEGEDDSVE